MAESIKKELVWQYKIELESESIETIKELFSQKLSREFLSFVDRANGAMPSKKTIQIGDEFYLFNNVLNFNLEGECAFSSFYGLLKDRGVLAEEEIPFGSNGRGGYYLLNLANQKVIFLDLQSEEKRALIRFDLFIAKIEG